jgi:hypothetical protein
MKKPTDTQHPSMDDLSESLKEGIESLSDMDLSKVRIHVGSSEPPRLADSSSASGTNIHLAAQQPRESWHVIQDTPGRVKPTPESKTNLSINEDAVLEREADDMGARAVLGAPQKLGPKAP